MPCAGLAGRSLPLSLIHILFHDFRFSPGYDNLQQDGISEAVGSLTVFLQSCHWEDWLSQALSQPCMIEDDSAGIGGFHLSLIHIYRHRALLHVLHWDIAIQ